jgi:hypothetical protein
MNLKERIEVFDRDSKLLEEITSTYPQESDHHHALRRAVSALWYVLRGGHDFDPGYGTGERLPVAAPKKQAAESARDLDVSLDRSA